MSEIRLFSFTILPKGWARCDGQLLPINQNQALFSLLGTSFGGNGQTNFALPDFRGRVPVHQGPMMSMVGQSGGQSAHTLTISEMPAHTHRLNGSISVADANPPVPGGHVLAGSAPNDIYTGPGGLVAMSPAAVTNVGGSQAHENMQPFLTLVFCIALIGVFPSRN